MSDPLTALAQAGVSIWLDDLNRARLTTGSLAELVAHSHVTGVTTNPTIFAKAISDGRHVIDALHRVGISYDDVVQQLEHDGIRTFGASWDRLRERLNETLPASSGPTISDRK